MVQQLGTAASPGATAADATAASGNRQRAKIGRTRGAKVFPSMPKWSEVPWGTVITGLVAVYGAVLGTLNFRRAGPKLRCEIRTGMTLIPADGDRTYIQTEVINYGDRLTTLTNIVVCYFEKRCSWARLLNRATIAAVLNNPNPEKPLPYELKPGGAWSALTEQEPELQDWGTRGALYFDLYHSHHKSPVRKRVRFRPPRKAKSGA